MATFSIVFRGEVVFLERLRPTARSFMKTVGLVQINRPLNLSRQRFKGRRATGTGVRALPAGAPDQWQLFPYSVGMLQAYAQAHVSAPDAFTFLEPLHVPLPVHEAVERLKGADVVGFSTYVWNIELSLEIARRLKEVRPATLVVFGGPQVPDRAEAFLRANPAIDVACHGEGERTFLALLERSDDRDWSELAGISHLSPDSAFHHRPQGPRLADLSQIPSPYLTGVFDSLLARDPRRKWAWIMLWETNRGCPFACTFCDWGSALASKVYQFDRERLRAELDWYAQLAGEVVFCCDANFGILPRDVDIAADAIEMKRRYGAPRMLAVQNTKNATERAYKVQKMLADAEMNAGVTISLQSTDPRVLTSIKRDNISLGSFQELQRRYTRDRIETYTDVILGLPSETFDSFANGLSQVIENGQHNRITFYNCSLLPNAEMNQPDYRAAFGLEAVRQRMTDLHGPLSAIEGECPEYLDIVIGTSAMPRSEWARAKAFWWMTDLLHFDRVLQIPFVVAHSWWGIRYRDLVDAFTSAAAARYPVVAGVHDWLLQHARSIQEGGIEFVPSEECLGLFWPADQYALIRLATTFQTDAFYDEAESILLSLANGRKPGQDLAPLREALMLNRLLLRLPFEIDDAELELTHNVWEAYLGALSGTRVPCRSGSFTHRIERTKPVWLSWEEWYEHLTFCQNRKVWYLYPVSSGEDAISSTQPSSLGIAR
jgi:radical SAM superfamily enzyme YgiQ (UPF0313 family)